MARIVEKSATRGTVMIALDAEDYTTLETDLLVVLRATEVKRLATALSDAGYVVTEPTG